MGTQRFNPNGVLARFRASADPLDELRKLMAAMVWASGAPVVGAAGKVFGMIDATVHPIYRTPANTFITIGKIRSWLKKHKLLPEA